MLSLLAFVVYTALFHSVSAFRKHDASKEVVHGAILSAQVFHTYLLRFILFFSILMLLFF
jgi:hypothetical protein